MKPSIALTRSKKALTELKAAMVELGSIRPSEAMSTEEFFELCDIRSKINGLVAQLGNLVKGGQS